MVDANEIKAAVELMDRKDPTQWEANGAPKLEVIQKLMNNDAVTLDDVDEAIGALKRTDAAKTSTAGAASEPGPGTGGATPKAAASTDPNDPNAAAGRVKEARAKMAELTAATDAAVRERAGVNDKLNDLKKQMDAQIQIIERDAPQVDAAAAVKAIQAQTQERLATTKEQTTLAANALKASGMNVYPSKLDATLATRVKTPEQKKNYAAFVHQTADNRTAQRG